MVKNGQFSLSSHSWPNVLDWCPRVMRSILRVTGQLCCEKTWLENFGQIWIFSTGPGWSKMVKNGQFSLSSHSWPNVLDWCPRVMRSILRVTGQLCCEKTWLENFGQIWIFSTGPGWSKMVKNGQFSLSSHSWPNVLDWCPRVMRSILRVTGQLCCEKTWLENFGQIWIFSTGQNGQKWSFSLSHSWPRVMRSILRGQLCCEKTWLENGRKWSKMVNFH